MAKPEEHLEELAKRLREVMRQPEERISLAEAALLIAAFEYTDLDPVRYIRRLDQMAGAVAARVPERTDPLGVISQINRFLFEEEGFRGNTQDYYDPRNSFLNDVLDRRTGIPIMLSTVYLEIAGRLQFPLVGVGMPGHFLVKHPHLEILIDPFGRGRILTAEECEKRMKEVLGESVPFDASYLAGVSKLHTVTRMLNNLRNVYLNLRQFGKALQATELALALHPDSPEEMRQKAAFLLELRRYPEALVALERYLQLAPEASDADELKQTAVNLRKTLAQLN
ncbi:MAG TPA: transglutaminase-like domain-containing protein [Terriglobia bacterium]|jgi:regulator of sirC expression with transglutaminase-like and TPR domain